MEIKKALTFRASSIGDCLMGKYLLDNVHAQFPQARLGIVVGSRGAMIRDLLAPYPYIEVIEANRKSPGALWRLYREWRHSDLVVTQYAGKRGGRFSLASKLMARLLARRGHLVGFEDAFAGNARIYDALVRFSLHEAPAQLERKALAALKITAVLPYPSLAGTFDGTPERFGLRAGSYVLVHFFSGSRGRGISPGKKREVLSALARRVPHMQLVVTGGAQDRQEAEIAAEGLPAIIIAGQATLQELAALMCGSAGVVAVDTGVAHMAAQLGRPLVVLSTCLGAHWWGEGQYKNPRIRLLSRPQPCEAGHIYKEYPACIEDISTEDAAAQAQHLFNEA